MATDDRTADSRGARPFHEKFDHLLRTVRNPRTGELYTLQEISDLLPPKMHGRTKQYLSNLRAGKYPHPSLGLIEGLAKIFQVNTGYFFDSAMEAKVEEEVEARRKLQEIIADPNSAVLALYGRGLSTENLGPVLEIVRRLRQLEGLDDVDEEALRLIWNQGFEQQ